METKKVYILIEENHEGIKTAEAYYDEQNAIDAMLNYSDEDYQYYKAEGYDMEISQNNVSASVHTSDYKIWYDYEIIESKIK